jgi:excisionase family DNA binding protein
VEKLALTISEAAALGGPCRSALYQDIKNGRLRAIKRGRSTRILMDDFKAYLASFPSLPPVRAKQAADPERSDAQGSFDLRGPQSLGDVDRSSDRGA